jgi:hypothetical protein
LINIERCGWFSGADADAPGLAIGKNLAGEVVDGLRGRFGGVSLKANFGLVRLGRLGHDVPRTKA